MKIWLKMPIIIGTALILAPVVAVALRGGDLAWTRPQPPEGPVLVVGGEVNLGRRQNRINAESGPAVPLGRIPDLAEADLAYVNLKGVVATTGEYRVEKGESAPFYYRARPENLAVLRHAGIDVVGTADDHAGDYGPAALAEQSGWLDAWGIGHAGSGVDRESACAPAVRTAGDLAVAFFAVDATMRRFAATDSAPGTCWLDPSDVEVWTRHFEPRIAAAREVADVVVVAVHGGESFAAGPTPQLTALGHALVDAGADAVVGSSAHVLQGVEVYRGRPILHDTGSLLLDAIDVERTPSAIFSLVLGPAGVRAVSATPIWVEYGTSRVVIGREAPSVLAVLDERSQALGTATRMADGQLWFDLPDPPARPGPPRRAPTDGPLPPAPPTPTEPPAACIATEVPEDARIEPVRVGPLVLVGVRTGPERLARRSLVDFETWWTVDEPVGRDMWLEARAVRDGGEHRWSGSHDGCDWAWPVDRWQPGVIWHDQYALRPSAKPKLGSYQLQMRVVDGDGVLGTHDVGHLEYGTSGDP